MTAHFCLFNITPHDPINGKELRQLYAKKTTLLIKKV